MKRIILKIKKFRIIKKEMDIMTSIYFIVKTVRLNTILLVISVYSVINKQLVNNKDIII